MSVITILRTENEDVSGQPQQVTAAQPQSYWPLPATLALGAHLTWAEWVARLATEIASTPYRMVC